MAPHFQELVDPGCMRPHLFSEARKAEGVIEFDAFCEVVLYALADQSWNGRWELDEASIQDLHRRIDDFSNPFSLQHLAATRGGLVQQALTLDEILEFIKEEENHQYIHELPSALHGILGQELVLFAFGHFDKDNSGELDIDEWTAFLLTLKGVHLQYLLCTSFQEFRAFYGRGQTREQGLGISQARDGMEVAPNDEEGGPASSPATPSGVVVGAALGGSSSKSVLMLDNIVEEEVPPTFQLGRDPDCVGWRLVPPGWANDLYYYSANNHPLHGIFACDPYNLLSRPERLFMEIATVATALITVRLHVEWVEKNHAPIKLLHDRLIFSLAVVTLPSMLMWWLFFLLFTCPRCGHVNIAQSSQQQAERARLLTRIGDRLAYTIAFLDVALCVFFYRHCFERQCHLWVHLPRVLRGRLQSYVISYIIMLCVCFNPFVAWGQTDPELPGTLGDYVGIGQWRLEKQRFRVRYQRGCSKRAFEERMMKNNCGCRGVAACAVQ